MDEGLNTATEQDASDPPTALVVPAEPAAREAVLAEVRRRVRAAGGVPPLTMDELGEIADEVVRHLGLDPAHREFAMVLAGNAAWEPVVAAIPFERRIVLLPQCLRTRADCPAEIDAFGLLCEQCGSCPTGELQAQAEALGSVVLVAEGTTVVTALLESGQAEAVIGVGCLHALERSYPSTVAAAVPALAIPLFVDGCDATRVDLAWVRQAVQRQSEGAWGGRLDFSGLRQEVDGWFEPEPLAELLEPTGTRPERLAREWVAAGGKRWRPYLAACVYAAIAGHDEALPEQVRRIAVAVECFHKASLVHDDIEDGDLERYGRATMHAEHGVPTALNTGDLLIGEGYRLLAECGAPERLRARMLTIASRAHRELCLGQGEELLWTRRPRPLELDEVLGIFRRKTAPAFEVALVLGAVAAGADETVCGALRDLSAALGTAYQIRDDLQDQPRDEPSTGGGDVAALRPSILLALALEHAEPGARGTLEGALERADPTELAPAVEEVVHRLRLRERARGMIDELEEQATRALRPLTDSRLKCVLLRLVHKVLGVQTGPPLNPHR